MFGAEKHDAGPAYPSFRGPGPTALGNLRAWATGGAAPLASVLNYAAGQTRANNAVLPLGPGGGLDVLCTLASGTAHVVLDVNGWFE